MSQFMKVAVAALLLSLSAPAFAWQVGSINNVPRKIIKVHSEYASGAQTTAAYFISRTEVITLTNLDRSDVQAIKRVLDDAFAQNKGISWARNNSRASWVTATWYDANDAETQVTLFQIGTGESVLIRISP